MAVKCALIKLRPGCTEQAQAWAKEINSRKDEALLTLVDEGVSIESVFLIKQGADDFLIYYMRSDDFQKVRNVVEKSTHAIDTYHNKFKRECWDSITQSETLIDLMAEL